MTNMTKTARTLAHYTTLAKLATQLSKLYNEMAGTPFDGNRAVRSEWLVRDWIDETMAQIDAENDSYEDWKRDNLILEAEGITMAQLRAQRENR